ncbi:MAG: DNA internalization-related competence protein ComEC/Rec2 [Phycisphaerae bacterium]|nr:DNA internalization-related competence protein ComEC/Rec2 [Phycisphaerae bacterium]
MANFQSIRKSFANTPLVPIAIATIGGIILAHHLPMPTNFIPIALIAILIAIPIITFIFYNKPTTKHIFTVHLLLCIAIALFAALRYNLKFNRLPANHHSRYANQDRSLITLQGKIISEPYITENQSPFKSFSFTQRPSTIFTLKTTSIKTKSGWLETSGNTLVAIDRITDIHPTFILGQTIQFDATISRRQQPANFAQFDKTRQYRITDKLTTCNITHPDAITIICEPANTSFARLRRQLQNFSQQSLLENDLSSPESPNNQAFLTALLLGDRKNLTQQQYDNFIATGTIHFLSISGLHVGILTGFVWLIFSRVFRNSRNSSLATLAFLIIFLIIIPPRAPALRASIIAATYIIASMFQRRTNTLNTLALSIIIILLIRPTDLFSRGFQLSYIIVLSLYFFAGPLHLSRIIKPINHQQIEKLAIRYSNHRFLAMSLYRIKNFILATINVSVIAAITSMPLTAYYFNRISLTAIIASAILMPIITATLTLGLLKITFAAIIPQLSLLIAWPLAKLSTFSIWTVNSLAAIPYSSLNTKSPPLILIIIFYALMLAIATHHHNKNRFSKILLTALALWLIPFTYTITSHDTDTKIHNLSIGDGLCTIIELPSHTIIYDTGSLTNFDLTRQIVAPFLRAQAINNIDALFISHTDIDHFSGIPDLCQSFNIKTIYTTKYLTESDHPAAKILLAKLKKQNQTIKTINAANELTFDQNTFTCLWPPADTKISTPNNQSLVLRLQTNDTSILLTGDIEQSPQHQLIQTHPKRIQTDIMIMPHHGSINTLYPKFITHCNPKLIINSMGTDRHNKIPKLKTLFPTQTILNTIEKGSITITIDNKALNIKTYK